MMKNTLTGSAESWAESAHVLENLRLRDYAPRRRVVTAKTAVPRSSVPAVDAHNHLGRWLSDDDGWVAPDVPRLIATMKRSNVRHIVNLDGRWGTELDENLRRYDQKHPELFSTFCQVDFGMLARGAGAATALEAQLRDGARRGAKGLKVWKNLGLEARNDRGVLVLPDDPVLAPLFETAGELALPVTIHTADPVAFFDPVDRHNERLENLLDFPDWWFGAEGFPRFDRLMDALEGVVAAHPATTFIGAHVGCDSEDLGRVSRMLESYPNYHVDLSARMAELGRQPRATRRLILEHPAQVLFGTDAFPVSHADYARWFRFLESDDECFSYYPEEEDGALPPMGRWDISALDLPAEALDALYAGNAARILGLG